MKKITLLVLVSTASFLGAQNTGIATTSPTATLDVNGDTRIRTLPMGASTDKVVVADLDGNLKAVPRTALNSASIIAVNTPQIKKTADVAISGYNPAAVQNVEFYRNGVLLSTESASFPTQIQTAQNTATFTFPDPQDRTKPQLGMYDTIIIKTTQP